VKLSIKKLSSIPPFVRLASLLSNVRGFYLNPQRVPSGHYYSPIPARKQICTDRQRIFGNVPRHLPGIDLNEARQMELIEQLRVYYGDLPFPEKKNNRCRFYYENGLYSYADAIFLYCMIRHLRPKKVVEIGSGFSTCVILETSERFLHGSVGVTCIEPYPERLMNLLRRDDHAVIQVVHDRLQNTPLKVFESLGENDLLLIDGSHTLKAGSDVNDVLFRILPSLNAGVYIHFHDIFYPFEYPESWLLEGISWNETYALRAFLFNNSAFEIVLFTTFMEMFHEDYFRINIPLCLKNRGASLWLRKAHRTLL
jgi:predicted O-methyltransferase YrrM